MSGPATQLAQAGSSGCWNETKHQQAEPGGKPHGLEPFQVPNEVKLEDAILKIHLQNKVARNNQYEGDIENDDQEDVEIGQLTSCKLLSKMN